MWRQGQRCYRQVSLQQGYYNQWPVMVGRGRNVGRSNPGMSHPSYYANQVQRRNAQHSFPWKNRQFSRRRGWKRGYWRRTGAHWKKRPKHWCTARGQRRFCKACQSHRRYSRKRFFRRQRLLAFMRAAIKGRLRPMNLCGWRAPGMRAPRNTTQFIMHQVYQDMRQEEKRAAAAAKAAAASAPVHEEDEEPWELQLSPGYECNMEAASSSCMATISTMTPEWSFYARDEVAQGSESSRRSQALEHMDVESHLCISCET